MLRNEEKISGRNDRLRYFNRLFDLEKETWLRMAEEKSKAVYMEFYRKPVDRHELYDPMFPGEKWQVQVEKIVELSKEEYLFFTEELYGYYPFIYDNAGYMYFDDEKGCAHSILVTTLERQEGILVQAEGFSYVRYGAYVPDCSVLVLSGIPVESHVPGIRVPKQPAMIPDPQSRKRNKTLKNHTKERGER